MRYEIREINGKAIVVLPSYDEAESVKGRLEAYHGRRFEVWSNGKRVG